MLGYADHVLAVGLCIDGDAYLLAHHAELFDGSGAIHVACHEQRVALLLGLEQVGELAAEGGLSGTLQTGHEDDGWLLVEVQVYGLTAHELSEFVVHELHHELSRLDGCEHVHAEGFFLHGVGEGLGHLVVHVGVEECAAHVLEGFGHIDFGYLAFALEYLE